MSNTKSSEETSTQHDSESYFKIETEHQYPDPIISRLRLIDGFGNPIKNPKLLFRDCEVIGFFFATLWNPHKEEFQNHVLDFTQRNPHRFKCIYISIDSKKSDFEIATKDKAWIHMNWNDGSNLDDHQTEEEINEISSKFISPYETKLLNEIFTGINNTIKDSRPISRISLVQQMNILSTPTLSIYHLKKQIWLDKNVRHSLFVSTEQRKKAWESWEKGDSISLTWSDVYRMMRWTILISMMGLIYFILVKFDDSFNLLNLTENLMNLGKPLNSNSNSNPINHSPIESKPIKTNHLYSEF